MKKYRQAVSALVLRARKADSTDSAPYEFLLVHKPRVYDAWQLPQGGIEEGESPEQAAVRELREETGLIFDHIDHMCEAIYRYDFPPQFIARHQPVNAGQQLSFVVLFLCDDQRVAVDRKEVDDHVWIVPTDISRYLPRKEYADVIRKVLGEYEEMIKARKPRA